MGQATGDPGQPLDTCQEERHQDAGEKPGLPVRRTGEHVDPERDPGQQRRKQQHEAQPLTQEREGLSPHNPAARTHPPLPHA